MKTEVYNRAENIINRLRKKEKVHINFDMALFALASGVFIGIAWENPLFLAPGILFGVSGAMFENAREQEVKSARVKKKIEEKGIFYYDK